VATATDKINHRLAGRVRSLRSVSILTISALLLGYLAAGSAGAGRRSAIEDVRLRACPVNTTIRRSIKT